MSTLYITQNQFIVCVLLFSFPLTIYLITSIWFQLHFFLERRGEGGGGGNLQIFEVKLCKKYCKWCNWWRTWIEHRMPSYWATFYQGPLFLKLPKVLKISSSRSFHLMVFLLGNACIHLLPICDHHKHDVVHQTKLPASGWFTVV